MAKERGEGAIQDDLLVARVKAGDERSLQLLIDQYRQALFKAAYAILRNEEDAKDVLQEAWIKIYYALPQHEGSGLKTWMTRIVVHSAIDLKRKRARQQNKMNALQQDVLQEITEDSLHAPLDSTLLMKERREYIRSRLQHLPENYRDVVKAHYLEEKSYKQIAEELQVQPKTIEMRLYRARQWMRDHWKEEEFR